MSYAYKEKMRDAVYGAVIGDALGVPYEFMERDTFTCSDMIGYGTHMQPAGTWSDDSSMILATCMSLKDKKGEVDCSDIRNNFLKWLDDGAFSAGGEVFDIGNATYKALVTGKGQTGERSNGNGSLMRIIPLAFTDCKDAEIDAVSAITHGHRISLQGCRIFVHIAREILAGKQLKKVIEELDEKHPYERMAQLAGLERNDIRSSGFVVDTLEAAVWCVLTSDDLKECLLKAVNLGDDTDTVAAVAGALGGIVFSLDSVPEEWMNRIRNKELIESCI